ncbi:MAG: putative aliphatic sulfonates-binding protein precursor [Lentisphaerae bacterium ADurb.Bin242]|nr:MAG: putative aliphatic sulfonates-binding protein precursor [Lentisphaerae bacterium ADurb.Bin242]
MMKIQGKSMIRAALLVSAFLLLAGCGKSGQKTSNPEKTEPVGRKEAVEKKQAQVLRVGYQQGGSSTLPMLAKNEGYFEKTGVPTDFVLFTSSSDGLNALNVNKLDIGVSFGTCAPLTYVAKGARFVIIGGNLSGGHPILVRKGQGIYYKSIRDFKGKTVGTPRIFTSDVVFRGACREAGLDLKKDLTLVEFKRPVDVMEAVKSGKIDVGIGASNVIGQAKAAGLDIPLWSNDLFPDHPCCRIVTTEETLRTKRSELVNFLKAELLAEKKFTEDPESGVRADIVQQKFSEELARNLVLEPHQLLSADPNRKGVRLMWDFMKKIQYAEGEIDLDKAIDTSLYYEALQQLRKESPSPFWEKLEQRYKEQNL